MGPVPPRPVQLPLGWWSLFQGRDGNRFAWASGTEVRALDTPMVSTSLLGDRHRARLA